MLEGATFKGNDNQRYSPALKICCAVNFSAGNVGDSMREP
jgi:hypothetical protein